MVNTLVSFFSVFHHYILSDLSFVYHEFFRSFIVYRIDDTAVYSLMLSVDNFHNLVHVYMFKC